MDVKNNPNEIQKVKTYIKKHGAPRNLRFDANIRELLALVLELHPVDAVDIAFLYGKAKGYRQAKKELQEKSA